MDPGKRWNLLGGVLAASHSFDLLPCQSSVRPVEGKRKRRGEQYSRRSRCESGTVSVGRSSVSDELELALLLLSVPVAAAVVCASGESGEPGETGLVVADAAVKGFTNVVFGAAAVIPARLWVCSGGFFMWVCDGEVC